MTRRWLTRAWDLFTSLKLTIACLSLLMVLVVGCTLAQVNMGTFAAVDVYMRSFAVWWHVPGTAVSVPVLPGGALVGMVLTVNLVAAQVRRTELSWKKAGLWLVHAGLVLLIAGEFVTSLFQIDTRMAIEEGQTSNYVESPRELELVVRDAGDGEREVGIPGALLETGAVVTVPGTPLSLRVARYHPNADFRMRAPSDPPSPATMGVGGSVAVQPLPPVTTDDGSDRAAAFVEPLAGGRSYGTWLVSNVLATPQSFVHEGRTYFLSMRPRRWHLPYSLTLKKFRHDVYPGTDIPKNFSSLVHISNPGRGEERDVLIYMNQPLRYEGRTFYQASFGKNDTLSVLQVVRNPGWLIPYFACTLVTAGLLYHFAITMRRARARRAARES